MVGDNKQLNHYKIKDIKLENVLLIFMIVLKVNLLDKKL